jgi:hypothetical protein
LLTYRTGRIVSKCVVVDIGHVVAAVDTCRQQQDVAAAATW